MKKFLNWVLNVGLSGFVFVLMDKLPWSGIFAGDNWAWLVEERFSWLNAILFIMIFFTIVTVVSHISKKISKAKIDPIEKELRKLNHFIDEKNEIKVTWDMYIGGITDNDPHAYNIQFFCLKHNDIPIRMQYGCCSVNGCINNNANCDERYVQNIIESQLIEMRNKLKNK